MSEHPHTKLENPSDGMRRRIDNMVQDIGFVKRNWRFIVVLAAGIGSYSILAWSVREHHIIDNERCEKFSTAISTDKQDIAVLKEIVKSIPRIENKMDMLLSRIPRNGHRE